MTLTRELRLIIKPLLDKGASNNEVLASALAEAVQTKVKPRVERPYINIKGITYDIKGILFEAKNKRWSTDRQATELSKFTEGKILETMNNMYILDAVHEITPEMHAFIGRVEKSLLQKIMPRTTLALETYQWAQEQEAEGQTIEKFGAWATQDERREYVGKYRARPENIKADWLLAFASTPAIPQQKWDLT